jgi:hypothetical protein
MKKIIILLMLFIVAIGCRTTKKATESKVSTAISTEVKQDAQINENVKTDNDLLTEKEITIAETEYFKPDSTINTSKVTEIITDGKGVVKSTKTTTIKVKHVDKGTVVAVKDNVIKTDSSTNTTAVVVNNTTESKKNPIRWGWITILLIVVIGVLIYVFNSPIGTTIKTFFVGLFKKK